METKEQQKKIEILTYVARDLMPQLPYHNFSHALDVYSAINNLALLEGVSNEDRFLLKTAALLHDIIVVPGTKNNEEKSAEFARQCLLKIKYSPKQIQRVKQLILATKMPQNPQDYLERLLCDADLDNLGRKDFFKLEEKVRLEFGLPKGNKLYQQQLEFLKGHKYHTKIARKLRDFGKAINIQKLEKMLQEAKC